MWYDKTMNKPRKSRSLVTVAAITRSGAGKHDSRPRRRRSRGDAKRAAIRDGS